MRIYIAVIVSLVLVLAFGMYNINSLYQDVDQIMTGFTGLEQAVEHGDWGKALERMDRLEEKWSDHKSWWAVVIDHQEIDNIEMSMVRIRKYLDIKEQALALGEMAVLKHMLEHIPDKEQINLENIL